MNKLLFFELTAYTKKLWFYAVLMGIFAFGLTIASLSIMSSPSVSKYGTYSSTLMLAFMSLFVILFTTLTSAQTLLREHETRFASILYTTPILPTNYLLSRFGTTLLVSLVCIFTMALGFSFGRITHPEAGALMPLGMRFLLHLQGIVFFAVPNTLFCVAILSGIAWLTRNRLSIYVAGLFLYIGYMVAMIFSGSPLFSHGMPTSPETMLLSALFDPFGISAFFYQTQGWSVAERNSNFLSFSGIFAVNRVIYIGFACGILSLALMRFRFSDEQDSLGKFSRFSLKRISLKQKKSDGTENTTIATHVSAPLQRLTTHNRGFVYHLRTLRSIIRLDTAYLLGSILFFLMVAALTFAVGMEIYGEITKSIRLPERYATTGLMVNQILQTFPILCLPIVLFYSNEIVWRSRSARIEALELASPIHSAMQLAAKWCVLIIVIVLLTAWMLALGMIFQLSYNYPHIDLAAYLSLFGFAAFPLILSAGLALAVQFAVPNRFAGMGLATLLLAATSTGFMRHLGITHPLTRFTGAFGGIFSEMNGWDDYARVFALRMLLGTALTLGAITLTYISTIRTSIRRKPLPILLAGVFFTSAAALGVYLSRNLIIPDEEQETMRQVRYEQQYRHFQTLPQPCITDVETSIALYPERGEYHVSGKYKLTNKNNEAIREILVGFFAHANNIQGELKVANKEYKIYAYDSVITLEKPLQHLDTATFTFRFAYKWNGFSRHQPFNAIVQNGAFIRISRYFPRFGYQAENEIDNKAKRIIYNLGKATSVSTLESPRTNNEFMNLTMTISTSPEQTAIGVGERIKEWSGTDSNGAVRNFALYKTSSPIPFRFGLSSARYAIAKSQHGAILIEVFYHPQHHENVQQLLTNAKETLEYCEANFGKYPYSSIRFAEVSAFTRGFNATAYPETIFMTENVTFHAHIKENREQDVINELAGHELSHEWWGNALIAPDEREGSQILTETLAMYTENMLLRKKYGEAYALNHARLHHSIYVGERGFSAEQPLYRTLSENTHQHYSKGLVVMHQLVQMLGENRVNTALRNFLSKHRYPAPAPVSTDLLTELYAVTPTHLHTKIEDAFQHIIIYECSIREASVKSIGNEFEVQFDISAKKFTENGTRQRTNTAFRDSLELGITLQNGRIVYRNVFVRDSSIRGAIRLPDKPRHLECDPRLRLLHATTERIEKDL